MQSSLTLLQTMLWSKPTTKVLVSINKGNCRMCDGTGLIPADPDDDYNFL